ncbi:MAG: hypothetical protein COW73_02200 [Nitrospirae bacterium CG18_big_fil_WC_8_21_14_2_50_70_55]|nr:hypothetical protein [Deltaproteobacteria bacterium]OIP66189.1 MAG: hypothetical protein AUK30_02940 [Nitrospirae bacterium CG2_30_70_394]PIQ06828.1 MAG: hypothetical protein COW73_02200 [Nitrospirae bacterium CG18_big_fil_WC_8_21_14_2_50_70_55]PIU77641.1 MAG: hypothetical protein COS73_09620 [Nitrospirae bacterium CG06_land_8_20_14_3_00_70_43]PIX84480.1 MAG: hypothetical protein COZ33_00035 [Nitrospirae bacterium CG_4_10_14_3_um_filter_70_108]PJB96696.1 MAG: hypothetical protein CO080_0234
MEAENPIGLPEVLAIARRRAGTFAVIWVVIFAVAVALAVLLPPVYEAKTTILVEEQQIPPDMVRTTVTDFVEQRLQMINQQVMSRQNLLDLIKQFELYKKERKKETTEEVIDGFREDIHLNPISTEVVDKRTGRPMTATIAFQVVYQGENPAKVQQVANTLATYYLSQNLKAREEHAKASTEFLEKETTRLQEEMQGIDAQLIELKEKYLGSMPEQSGINMQTMAQMARDRESIFTRIADFTSQRDQLAAQLFTRQAAARHQGPTPVDRRNELRLQEAQLISKYSADHPDVVKIHREITGVEQAAAAQQQVDNLLHELFSARLALEAAGEKDKAPLQAKVADLRSKIQALDPAAAMEAEESALANDPYYVATKNQLVGVETNIHALTREVKAVDERIEALRQQILLTPKVGAEYDRLIEAKTNRTARYRDMRAKLEEAKASIDLEHGQMAERFSIIDPAIFPEEPIKPNRVALTLIGLILGVGVGVGGAAAREALDTTFHSAKRLARMARLPVLAVVGAVETAADLARRRRRRWLAMGSMVGVMVAAVATVHFAIRPLDVLWLQATGKVTAAEEEAQQAPPAPPSQPTGEVQ